MNTDRKETTFRIAGVVGLALLLGLVLWAQRENKSQAHEKGHDHAAVAQQEHSMADKPLDTARAATMIMMPSGNIRDGVRVAEYDAFQYNFAPDPLIVRAGEKVRLLVKSRDVTHGAMIPEIDFSTDIQPGERKAVEFIAPTKPGEYPVFCSVFCGPQHGEMKGRLVVLPADQEDVHHGE